jgi:hypothetical protein
MKINRLFEFYSAHLRNQITIAGLVSISNFGILYFAANFFTSLTEASEFLALFSLAIILSSYFSYVLLFRNGQTNKLIIDLPFLFITVVMILAASVYSPSQWILSASIVLLMFIREIYRFMGSQNSKNNGFLIKICIISITLSALLLLVNYYYSIKLINLLALGFIFMLQLSPIFLLKLDKNSLLISTKPKKGMNLFFNAAAEFAPIMAGYLVNVYSLNLMKAGDYVEYRSGFAVIGISSLIGNISLIVFLSDREKLKKHLPKLSVLMLSSILISLYYMDSLKIIIITTLIIFSISAIVNSYNKAYLSRIQHFYLQSMPAILIATYILNSNQLIPIQLLLVLSAIQVLLFTASCWMILRIWYLEANESLHNQEF